jgi:transcriptional regulator with XRE-family HTH domain
MKETHTPMPAPMITLDQHIGRVIRRRRKALGLSQKDVALALGVRHQQVQKYECAGNKLSANMLYRITKVLNLSMTDVFATYFPAQHETEVRDFQSLQPGASPEA